MKDVVGTRVKKTGVGASARFFGAWFGWGRGVVAVTALMLFLKATPFSQDPWWVDAKLQPHFSKLADWVKAKMPDELSAYFNFINPEELQKTLRPDLSGFNGSDQAEPQPDTQSIESDQSELDQSGREGSPNKAPEQQSGDIDTTTQEQISQDT